MKKSINDRCPLQVECERKKCDFIHTELKCPYYSVNARKDYYIDDQEEIRERQYRERQDAQFLESLGDDDDDDAADGGLVYIPIEQLYPHPDNPRKDLGDLTELADSIKVNGVLQNLTVVPRTVTGEITGETWQKGYTVVIGHRRLAASKLAGLKELPCVITDMDLRSQVQTMLMENIQRADLTLYEQAQGFQMMLDLGDSIDEIARKSGFSQTTVRRRVKLLELDQEKFKASVSRGANLMDYMELDKIDDPELKNEVLEAIGTNNFRQRLASAIETEKNRKFVAKRVQELSAFAKEIKDVDYSTMRYVRNYGVWDKKATVTRPDDADSVAYYYRVGSCQVDLYRQAIEEPKNPENEARKERIKAELEHRSAELKSASQVAYKVRLDFVKAFSAAKRSSATICRFAGGVLLREHSDPDDDVMSELLGVGVDTETQEIDTAAFEEKTKTNPEYALLAAAYAAFDSEGMDYLWNHWDASNQAYVSTHEENRDLDFLYEILVELGYEMSDEEKALQDGTHALFQEVDGA